MSECVILTENGKDGEKLKATLACQNFIFQDIQCITPKDLCENSNVEFLFSTWNMPKLTEIEIDSFFPKLRAVFYAAGTVKYFAEPFLKQGIKVFSAAKANGIPVAEYVASSIVLANKGFLQAQNRYKWPLWTNGYKKARRFAEDKYGNYGAKVGVVGCGAIGSKVIELLKPYKLDIMIYDPYVTNEQALSLGVEKVSILELFTKCDVITNHMPDIEETRGLIDYSLLSSMKSTATFINTGRGRQVIEKDLAKVMRKNPSMCALLDVTAHEPMFPWNPLYFCKNVFLTPHIAGSQSNEFGRMVEYMLQAYEDTQSGITSPYEVKLEQLTHQA